MTVASACLGLMLAGLAGCGGTGGSSVNDFLDAQLAQLGFQTSFDTSQIQMINQTQQDIQLDLLIDNVAVTLTCTAVQQRCTFFPDVCPLTVQAVEERRLTPLGSYTGGRLFNNNPEFTFTETEFDCQSMILFTFTDDETTAEVL